MNTQIALPVETLAAFDGDELRARVFYEKYALRDDHEQVVETRPEQMWDRVACELASVEATPDLRERWAREFRWLLGDFRFLPGGRILHGAGNPRKVTLQNCYVEGIQDDSIEGIYTAAMHTAKTYSRGGGIGIDVTPLRPAGATVHNAARHSTGAVSFMELFSLTTGLIGQSGRRGALMLTIADHHPDVLAFCKIKRNLNQVRYANISVRLTDAFMRAVEADGDWTLWFEGPQTGRIERTIRARELWDELVTGAHEWAEPGCLFWDRMVHYGTSNYNGMAPISTNPCGEEALEHGGCCDLGSLNLGAFVLDPWTSSARINWERLERAAISAVRFLDNVHDYNRDRHALPHQMEASLRTRRVGVGLTGLADLLVMLTLKYDSEGAIRIAEEIARRVKEAAYAASVAFAREKGPFPVFDAERHLAQPFFGPFPAGLVDAIRHHGLRNVSILTVPPTGSISAMAGVQNGLEPLFDLGFVRRSESLSQEFFVVMQPIVRRYLADHDQALEAATAGGAADITAYVRTLVPETFVTAHQIDPMQRVKIQAALQRHIDQSISSTVNLPRETTPETVSQVYLHAWRSGLKGISIYRESSREGVMLTPEEAKRRHHLVALAERVRTIASSAIPPLPLNGGAPERQIEHAVRALAERLQTAGSRQLQLISGPATPMRDRPQALPGVTYRIPLDRLGTLFVTINEHEGEPFEVFCRLGKSSADTEAQAEADGRLMSLILRLVGSVPQHARLEEIIHQLEGIGGSISIGFGANRVRSIPDGIARALRLYLERRTPPEPEPSTPRPIADAAGTAMTAASPASLPAIGGGSNGQLCPRCQRYTLVTEQGCAKCECGFKEC